MDSSIETKLNQNKLPPASPKYAKVQHDERLKDEEKLPPPSPEDAEVQRIGPFKAEIVPPPSPEDAEVQRVEPFKVEIEVPPPSPKDAEVQHIGPFKAEKEVLPPSPEGAEVQRVEPFKAEVVPPPSPEDAEVQRVEPFKVEIEVPPPSPKDAEVPHIGPFKAEKEVLPPSPEGSEVQLVGPFKAEEVPTPSPEDVEVQGVEPLKAEEKLPQPAPEDAEIHNDEPLEEEEYDQLPIKDYVSPKFSITQSDFAKRLKRVQKNITKGPYKDVAHYLRVYSDLMVEDYKGPLRNTIKSIVSQVRQKQNLSSCSGEEDVQSLVKEVLLQEEGYYSQDGSENERPFGSLDTIAEEESGIGLMEAGERPVEVPKPFSSQVHIHQDVTFLYEEHVNELFCYRIRIGRRIRFFRSSNRFWTGTALHFTADLENFFLGKVVWFKSFDDPELTVGFFSKPDIKFGKKYVMFEPRAFYELYHGIVKAIGSTTRLPMEKYLVHCDVSPKPPAYLNRDMRYRIEDRYVRVLEDEEWPDIAKSGLNESQRAALRAAVTQEFAVIHGPPGTGKTHVATKILEVLLANGNVHQQAPILVLSQTNVAVDNLLERVMALNVIEEGDILRVGSRSSSEMLEPYNLSRSRLRYPRWPTQWLMIRDRVEFPLDANLLMAIDAFDGIVSFNTFHRSFPEYFVNDFWHYYVQFLAEPSGIVDWLMEEASLQDTSSIDFDLKEAVDKLDIKSEHCYRFDNNDKVYQPLCTLKAWKEDFDNLEIQILEQPEQLDVQECYKKVGLYILYLHKKLQEGKALMTDESFEYWDYNPPNDEEGCAYTLHPDQRWKLYFSWLKLATVEIQGDIDHDGLWYRRNHLKRLQKRRDIDLDIFQNKMLIGMTTSGAVFHKAALEELRPSIVLVEEASEVLESHIIAAMTPHCQHLILIGDHKQLRPMTADHHIGKHFRLGISLFERMINNNMQSHMLDVQHRMHPQIADLVMPVYPKLKNHFSTLFRPPVCGTDRPVYFLHHTRPETECPQSKSKKNVYEAVFCCHLAQHLIRMGHHPKSITILAGYTFQVREISSFIEQMVANLVRGIPDGNAIVTADDLVKIHVTTLDGFQGQENDIILLSLVRNNPLGEIGFLNEDNRITVALSRAKIGLYILGNIEMLSHRSKLWRSVRVKLVNQDALVKALPLQHSNCFNPSEQKSVWAQEVHQVLEAHDCKCLPAISNDVHLLWCQQCGALCQQSFVDDLSQKLFYFCSLCHSLSSLPKTALNN